MSAGSRYVEVSREALVRALLSAGFMPHEERPEQWRCTELVFSRQHDWDPTLWVKVYTSLPRDAGDARACGEDAIRVVLVFDNPKNGKSGGLYKAKRVHRTGSEEKVIERMLERARECWVEANKRCRERAQRSKRGAR